LCSRFQRAVAAVSDATSSALEIRSGGTQSPVPEITQSLTLPPSLDSRRGAALQPHAKSSRRGEGKAPRRSRLCSSKSLAHEATDILRDYLARESERNAPIFSHLLGGGWRRTRR